MITSSITQIDAFSFVLSVKGFHNHQIDKIIDALTLYVGGENHLIHNYVHILL